MRLLSTIMTVTALTACGSPREQMGANLADTPDQTQACVDAASAIEDKLRCIPGLELSEASVDPTLPDGIKQYNIQFAQPIDHQHSEQGLFKQNLVLLHRSDSEPMILQTSGYSIFGVRPTSIMNRFATNQIQIEHRFFSGSTPAVVDWSKLDIKQSADDFHHITEEFKKIYKQAWVGTGASKGGMTSVYHRYFYPNDLDGTVADVAPLSFSTNDERYIDFVENAGGQQYAACRAKFKSFQRSLLEHRDDILPMIQGTFTHLGSADIAFEHSVLESHFVFWQYSNPEDPDVGCAKIPENATAQVMLDFLNKVNSVSGYTDGELQGFFSYYFQAATQLGNPANVTSHLQDLRKYDFTIDQYTPKDISYSYSNESMHLVKEWAATQAAHIMFVYGEFDPWSAGAFPSGVRSNDMHLFTVKAGNHSANFSKLDLEQRTSAEQILARWLRKSPIADRPAPYRSRHRSDGLEDLEFKFLRSHKQLK